VLNRFIILLISLFGLFSLFSCMTNAANAANAADLDENAAKQKSTPHGTLYRISAQGHTAYLFGTIHVGRPDFFPLEARTEKALADSSVLAMEIDLRDKAGLMQAGLKYGVLTGGDTLDKHVSPETLQHLQKTLDALGLSLPAVSPMKAWMVANELIVLQLEKQGYHTDLATEMYLLSSAEKQHKTVVGLETADFQLSLFDGLTEKQQEQYLNDNLDDLQSGEEDRKTKELIDAWASADEKAFADLLAEARKDQTESGQFFMRELIDKRNPAMTDKVEKLLKEDKASFVAVGLLHLVGDNGVPQLLAKRGYQVTRVY
jgi:uncharacterized protein YbaP (TraB family)